MLVSNREGRKGEHEIEECLPSDWSGCRKDGMDRKELFSIRVRRGGKWWYKTGLYKEKKGTVGD